MRRWHRSMAGQLVTLLIVGLLVTQLLAVLLLRSGAEMLNPISRDEVLERLVIAHRIIQVSPQAEVPELLGAMGSEGARFWVEDAAPPPHTDISEEEQRVLYQLSQKIHQTSADGLWVQLTPPENGWFSVLDTERGWSTFTLQMAVRLPDDRWLHSLQRPLAGYQWWRLLRFSVPASMLPVLVIVLLFVYRTLRPLKALARAAERVSRGERIEPLRLEGPHETREVSAAFNLMQQKLTRFIDDRTQLLAAISHDFRTPITSLRLRAEMLDDAPTRIAMTRTLDDMRQMVEQTLRFSQDDASSEATRDLDLQALLDEVVSEHRALGHDARLEVHAPFAYRGRPVNLKRAVGNLVDNAVRHGQRARVRLRTRGGPCIEVDDDGPGLDPNLLERVFEPFFQQDLARNHAQGGVGLGLSIARSCARAHGGDVTLANRAEGGLRATLALP